MALIYKDRVKETTTTTGTGTLTLAGAASGYQAFSAVGDGNTCVYGLEASDGGWEVGIGTYTASGTTLARTTILSSSNSGSAITLPAGTHNVYVTAESSALRNGYLRNKAESPTTAGVTGEVGTMHVLDISGLTASRDFTLPATAAVGDRVGVMLSVGDASYEIVLKPDAADTINGGSAGAEWSRLLITGETVVFRCITADSAWVVEEDHRIACYGEMTAGSGGTWNSATLTVPDFATTVADIGDVVDLANNRFTIRRGNTYLCAASALSASSPSQTTGAFAGALYINTTLGGEGFRSVYAVSGNRLQMDRVAFKTLGNTTTLSAEFQHASTNTTFFSARFIIREILG